MEALKHAKVERKAQRRTEKAEAKRLADKRKSKEVKLNRLSSVSGGGGRNSGPSSKGDRECYLCGEAGHEKRDCPQRDGRSGDRAGGRKRSRSSLDY